MDKSFEESAQAVSAHQQYLNTLQRPTLTEARRISDIQLRKEHEIDAKYHNHSPEEHHAATKIQSAYRGHRERREQYGLVLDPSSRWMELIAEMKYRSVTAPHRRHNSLMLENSSGQCTTSPSDVAKLNWRRAGWIAEHAGRGETAAGSHRTTSDMSSTGSTETGDSEVAVSSMLMDLRYFLEMVDVKHRYGANLQIYHEFWQHQNTSQNFFHWLDRGAGRHIDLPLCSREKLDRERIRYLSREERKDYLVKIDEDGRLRWSKNDELITTSVDQYRDSMHGIVPRDTPDATSPNEDDQRQLGDEYIHSQDLAAFSHLKLEPSADDDDSDSSSSSSNEKTASHKTKRPRRGFHISPAALLNHLLRASVKPGTWIYVTDTLNRLYISIKSSGSFQHASFLSGARIRSAGAIAVENGIITYLSPLSGHYRPTTKSFRSFVEYLDESGVDLSSLKVSGAYKVLRGMEIYGKTKKGFRQVRRRSKGEADGKEKKPDGKLGKEERIALEVLHETEGVSATELVERHWDKDHRRRRKSRGS